MLDFCPYDFHKIDLNNLAYEMVFPEGWDWEKVKKQTVVGERRIKSVLEDDKRRYNNFNYRMVNSEIRHIILKEADVRNGVMLGMNGLELFKEFIEMKNHELEKYSEYDDSSLDAKFYADDSESDTEALIPLTFVGKDCKDSKSEYDYFEDPYHNPVIKLVPCCPHCHNRLPIGWMDAEDFAGVALIAPPNGGKTTLLYSMLDDKWAAFKDLGQINDKELIINTAHNFPDPKDAGYYDMTIQAKKMCRDKQPTCPDGTDTSHRIWPVFLKVEYDGHVMIVGIYDNAGEVLRGNNSNDKPHLAILTSDDMFAHIFLFDPENMNFSIAGKNSQVDVKECSILSMSEQGIYQEKNPDLKINAKELLEKARENVEKEGLFTVYDQVDDQVSHTGLGKDTIFLGVIIKCDLLERFEEVSIEDKYKELFRHKYSGEMLNLAKMNYRSELVKEMAVNMNLFGDRSMLSLGKRYANVSWHCVSALGCDAELNGKVLGKYSPIRVAEPLVTCIMKRMELNGWI